jgi:hypothetical protein
MQGKRENILVVLIKRHSRIYHDSIRIQNYFYSEYGVNNFSSEGNMSVWIYPSFFFFFLWKDFKSLLGICRVEKKEEMRSCEITNKQKKKDSIQTQQFFG